ncbi:hypothetical protein H072_5832 [Dactylellina haptotyla CBS 200.50]|uniref:Acyl-CoA thioesterase II n=1 Tax=Dactylellina haptotyla (strain CBS 200.50) TaxID=1284197 RepID=S8BLQ3_DACHA|nr:hypothetical protein H072_5832 [Dactylellina haptotyla CBS 200.50]
MDKKSATAGMEDEKSMQAPILKQIEVNTLEKDPFTPVSIVGNHYLPSRSLSIFGGQIIGQAILAAHATVKEGLSIHAFHGNFIDRTDPTQAVAYRVSPIRTGNTISNRLVHAFQYTRLVFIATVSFHMFEESPVLKYNSSLRPDFPSIESMDPVVRSDYYQMIFHDGMKENDEILSAAIEVKHKLQKSNEMPDGFEPPKKSSDAGKQNIETGRMPTSALSPIYQYLRIRGQLPHHPKYRTSAFAMASDAFSSQLPAVLIPHQNISWITSLDHIIYFHKPFDPTKWLAVENRVTVADGGRGVIEMKYWNEEGDLVATVLQEGMFRGKSKAKL